MPEQQLICVECDAEESATTAFPFRECEVCNAAVCSDCMSDFVTPRKWPCCGEGGQIMSLCLSCEYRLDGDEAAHGYFKCPTCGGDACNDRGCRRCHGSGLQMGRGDTCVNCDVDHSIEPDAEWTHCESCKQLTCTQCIKLFVTPKKWPCCGRGGGIMSLCEGCEITLQQTDEEHGCYACPGCGGLTCPNAECERCRTAAKAAEMQGDIRTGAIKYMHADINQMLASRDGLAVANGAIRDQLQQWGNMLSCVQKLTF